jgi:hypothetical protein
MILNKFANFVSRLVRSSNALNTLNVSVVEIFFQKSPGKPPSDDRGIEALDFQVLSGGVVSQTGKTGKDGKIEASITGGQAEVQLMSEGKPVASYRIDVRGDPYEAGNTIAGVQRRLRGLGYQLGHDGDDKDGVRAAMHEPLDRAILEFQVDQTLTIDGKADSAMQTKLSQQVGGTAV